MSFDESNFDDGEEEAALPEESNNNRTFLIAVGILNFYKIIICIIRPVVLHGTGPVDFAYFGAATLAVDVDGGRPELPDRRGTVR